MKVVDVNSDIVQNRGREVPDEGAEEALLLLLLCFLEQVLFAEYRLESLYKSVLDNLLDLLFRQALLLWYNDQIDVI